MIIDTHCHIYDQKLLEQQKEILDNLQQNDILAICSGDNIDNSIKCIELANTNKNVFATVGIHPHEAKTFNDDTIQQLKELVKNKKVVAIGEIGLDYYYDFSPREIQKNVLLQQINLAHELKLPCVFHVREATQDFLDVIKALKFKVKGVVHSFSDSVEVAKFLTNYGLKLGVNGIVTFKNANKIKEVVSQISLDDLLIETDSPYLTPEPFRGKLNEPKYVELVAQKIAEIKNVTIEEVILKTLQNAKKLFNLN
ncbi:MAG: TatD family hydrolase [Clostridia bacterium]|nr:TatD family hydrolase [Clostridia bacterium]